MFKPVHFLICDDIRHEVRGKLTLVGSYGNSIDVSSFPATLRFAYRVEVQFDTPGKVKLEFSLTDAADLSLVEASLNADILNVATTAVIPIGPLPLAAEKAGEYRAFLGLNGVKHEVGRFFLKERKALDKPKI